MRRNSRRPMLLRTPDGGGIVEAPMDAPGGGRKDGATFLGVVADGDDVIDDWPANSSTDFDRWPDMSMPISPITAMASERTWLGFVPALATLYAFPASWRSNPSAIWLRAELPVPKNQDAHGSSFVSRG